MAVRALRTPAMPGGGRGVKRERLLSGACTQNGRTTALKKVMDEKTTSDKLPTRPTSPSISVALARSSFGTS